MKYKIALLLKKHSIEFLEKTIGHEYKSCSLKYFEYADLYDLRNIFEREQSNYDGFVTSYIMPMTVLKGLTNFKNSKPIVSFDMDVENMYRIILQIILEKNSLSDVNFAIDNLDELLNIEDMIKDDFLNEHIKSLFSEMETASFDELVEIEDNVLTRHLELANKGERGVIVTFFYSVVHELAAKGFECHYVYPGKHNIEYAFDTLEKKIQMNEIQKRLPGVIYINPMIEQLSDMTTMDIEVLFSGIIKKVVELSGEYGVKPIVKRDYSNLEIYLDAVQLQRLTRNYTYCFLIKSLTEDLDFKGTIGYGIGKNIYNSLINAITASKYSINENFKYRNSSTLIDTDGELYILSSEENMQIGQLPNYLNENYIAQISKISRLSPKTINRIISFLQYRDSNMVTTQELADFFEITKRGASKTINSLVNSGLAKVEDIRHDGEKGRPENIYKIYIEYK